MEFPNLMNLGENTAPLVHFDVSQISLGEINLSPKPSAHLCTSIYAWPDRLHRNEQQHGIRSMTCPIFSNLHRHYLDIMQYSVLSTNIYFDVVQYKEIDFNFN